ncbi:MAG TPA: hypothetical protein VMW41_06280 [Candidatus Bathyarchaeia archaeon]|nr:hypothetical protein [Candidatus Bathyarchaeia archaeon]
MDEIRSDTTPRKVGRLSPCIFPADKRTREIELINQASLSGKNAFLILSERGAGKSSLAAYLAEYPPEGCNGGAYLDLQSCLDYDDFIHDFAGVITSQDEGFNQDTAQEADIINYFSQHGRFLIAIDEIEKFIGDEGSSEDRNRFCVFLKSLRESCSDLVFLFCAYSGMSDFTRTRINELIRTVSSPEDNLIIKLKPIPPADRPPLIPAKE